MYEFKMPSLGAEMESGKLIKWNVKQGDSVKRGDIVAVVDTDKAAVDVEIWDSGVVDQILVEPGTKVPVGTVLARVRTPTEAPSATIETAAAPAISRPKASPAARKRAQELSVDISKLLGTGPDGSITISDVENFASKAPTGGKGMRATIAAAMARSKREIPHYYLSADIDMGRATLWLSETNLKLPITERILPAALLLKAVASALREVPELNGFWINNAFSGSERIHVGVAISLRDGGLVAPAIHDVDKKTIKEVMSDLRDLVTRGRSGSFRSSELSDATVTVTNLGDQGVESVFGIIYPPQVALVGFGRITEKPCALNGAVNIRQVLTASLSADHRSSDGHRGAVFLSTLNRILQEPEKL